MIHRLRFVLLITLLAIGLVVAPAATAIGQEPTQLEDACPDGSVPEDGFHDVAVSSAHEYAIDCLVWWSVTKGKTTTEYGSRQDVSRAQIASFIAQSLDALGIDLPDDPGDRFDDDNGNVHEPNINRLAAYGVIDGTGLRTFSPDQKLVRAQMASLLVRAYEQATGTTVPISKDWFDDDNGHWHETNINKLAELGITYGVGDRTFEPAGPVLRDQIGSFLARLLDRFLDHGIGSPPPASDNGQTGNDGDPCDVNECPKPFITSAQMGDNGDGVISDGDRWTIDFSEPMDTSNLDFDIEIRSSDAQRTYHNIRFSCATGGDFVCAWAENHDAKLWVWVNIDTGLSYPATIQDIAATSRHGQPVDRTNQSSDPILD